MCLSQTVCLFTSWWDWINITPAFAWCRDVNTCSTSEIHLHSQELEQNQLIKRVSDLLPFKPGARFWHLRGAVWGPSAAAKVWFLATIKLSPAGTWTAAGDRRWLHVGAELSPCLPAPCSLLSSLSCVGKRGVTCREMLWDGESRVDGASGGFFWWFSDGDTAKPGPVCSPDAVLHQGCSIQG